MLEWIGWVATAVFAASYLFKEPTHLRRVQALAATLWFAYGIIIHAAPVVVANAIVATVALVSSFKRRPLSSNRHPDASAQHSEQPDLSLPPSGALLSD
jgi:hypothetical protein